MGMFDNLTVLDQNGVKQFIQNLNKNQSKWHQFYNITDPSLYAWYSIQRRGLKFSKTPKEQALVFFDIEVDAEEGKFPDPEKATWAINSLSMYSTKDNKLFLICIPPKNSNISDIKQKVIELYKSVESEHKPYQVEGLQFEIYTVLNDKELIRLFFKILHSIKAVALLGYNSSLFDIPYIFNRMIRLFGKDQYKTIASQFGEVKKFGMQYEIPDMAFIDMLVLYKPQSAGGMAFGSAQVSYDLDHIANVEVGVGKLEYDGNLIELYQKDPIRFFVYNMFDTILLHLLNQKLQHADTLYGLSQFAGAPMSKALVGRSLLYQFNKTMAYWDNGYAIMSKLYNEEIVAVSD